MFSVIILYILIAVVGGVIATVAGFFQDPSNNPIGALGMIASCIGFYGAIIHLWFKLLKLFYPKASTGRLWGITGYILWIIVIVCLCFTGIGAISLATIKHPIKGLIPKETDKKLQI